MWRWQQRKQTSSPLVTLPFPPSGYGSSHAWGWKSPFPIPRQEDGEYRKSETDINAFFLKQECLHALPQTSARHLAQPTGFVNKSASGLNRGGAVIKLRPEAIAREMSGNLTERPGKEISLWKHTLGGQETGIEFVVFVDSDELPGMLPCLSSQLNFSRFGNVYSLLFLIFLWLSLGFISQSHEARSLWGSFQVSSSFFWHSFIENSPVRTC